MNHLRFALGAALLGVASCGDPPPRGEDLRATAGAPGTGITTRPADSSAAAGAPPTASSATSDPTSGLPGIRFDPATVREGDRVGAFRVARVDITDAGGDYGRVGTVRFLGEVTISGAKRPHPDYPDITTVCMDVDSASAGRLPRWPRDSRTQSWLCFENQEEAIRLLGPAGTREPITVTIDTYQTPRQFSDVYNTARLVRVEERPG